MDGGGKDIGIDRESALCLMRKYLKKDNLQKHSLATEAVMRAMARRLGYDEDSWGITGLLHDLDYEQTHDNPSIHGLKTTEILERKGADPKIIQAIKAHNAEALGLQRKSDFDFALTCAECITGLIIATTLVYPDKKIASVKSKSIIKRMKQKEFARNVSRELIQECEKVGIPLTEFAELSLNAMKDIGEELGL
ncbi:MAG: HDIG domain-containing protein [Thermodesulfobacteriota bacterium]|nr:HDIG domain-containing protein [Thermodesulfobacteriota bacterium]